MFDVRPHGVIEFDLTLFKRLKRSRFGATDPLWVGVLGSAELVYWIVGQRRNLIACRQQTFGAGSLPNGTGIGLRLLACLVPEQSLRIGIRDYA